jgi:N6-adenosine-specific RNA methylase IME4
MSDEALIQLDGATRLLEKARTVAEVVQIADACEAARVWAKRSKAGIVHVNKAVEWKIRCERKAGQMLAKMEKQNGDPRSHHVTRVRDIGVSKMQSSRWQRMAIVPEKDLVEYIADSTAKEREITSNAVLKMANKSKPKSGAKKVEDKPLGFVTSLSELVGQKFGCIYADPPWKYDNQGTRASTDNHYSTMTVDEICALPIKDIAAEKCHLHLWTTNGFLFECPRIFDAWGFEFKSSFVWVKPQMGIGNYWRNSHEILLLAVRGGLVGQDKSLMSWVECGRGKHSAKPDIIRGMVEKLSPGPRLEMFGRRSIPGWTVFGNEILEML